MKRGNWATVIGTGRNAEPFFLVELHSMWDLVPHPGIEPTPLAL